VSGDVRPPGFCEHFRNDSGHSCHRRWRPDGSGFRYASFPRPKDENLTEDLGVVELATLRFVVRDDTSTHSQGFWYKILDESTDCRIRVQILENGSYNDFFYGVLSKEEIVWTETYLGIPRIRTAEFTVVSIIAKLFDVDMGDFLDDVYDYSTLFDCNPGAGVTTNWKYVIPSGRFWG